VRGIDLKIDDIWGLDLFMTGRACCLCPTFRWLNMETAINLPTDILASGDRTAVGKPELRRHIEAWECRA
jgi:hypothetical protein